MSVSGFDDQYFFYGFLPKQAKALEKEINTIKDYNLNIVFFIPAIKLNFYINYFKKFFKNREIFIGREMTKIHEEFIRDDIESIKNLDTKLKGEIIKILDVAINLKKKSVLGRLDKNDQKRVNVSQTYIYFVFTKF